MKAYTVNYKMNVGAEVKQIIVLANNKWEAYDKAEYEAIPEKEGEVPYSAWVWAVTHNNGRYQTFNTFEGKPI